jgi:replication-associated recombination protein RarA
MIKKLFLSYPLTTLNKKVLILFGAPEVGKGTYAKLIRKEFKFNHISTGD